MSNIDICEELHNNFMEFAREANSERAFPDVRDGLKPGQRACLWEMYSKGYTSNKPHVKSAKISGGTAASWWPHGTTAIYETFARMSQPWINNVPEVDWHGNNGNVVIGQFVGADRYTEARLSPVVEDGMLFGLKKGNVPMTLNFSEDEEWPEVLPAVFPRLLVNGSQGIGVTLANTWLPMNFKEAGEAIIEYLRTGIVRNDYKLIDFPSGGIIANEKDLPIIHNTGKGRVILRGRASIDKNTIKITELPYQVYVEPFIDEIKKIIEQGELTQIKEIYNKTDKKQLLIEIECTSNPQQVLDYLYLKTDLQITLSANQWALNENKTPQLFEFGKYLEYYKNHNLGCIVKEYNFDLNKAVDRKEIVDGLLIALEDIDNVITLIKSSKSSDEACIKLKDKYNLTDRQSKAIVDMKLGRLANLEKVELETEYKELTQTIQDINNFLCSEEQQKALLIERLQKLINKYGVDRRSDLENLTMPNKIQKQAIQVEPDKVVVVMTAANNIKRIPIASFKEQKRNTKGAKLQKDDITIATIRTNTVDNLLVFTNKGKVYKLSVNSIPVGTNTSTGSALSSLISFQEGEEPETIYSVYRDSDIKYVGIITTSGIIKKLELSEVMKMRAKNGANVITLNDGDNIADVTLLNEEDLLIVSKNGQLVRIASDFRASGKTAKGINGMKLNDGDEVMAMLPLRDNNDELAIFLSGGQGKRMSLSDLTKSGRNTKGVRCAPKGNEVTCISLVNDKDSLLLTGSTNTLCMSAKDISTVGRAAAGTTMIKNDAVLSVTKI